jgi:hypothetical protein
MSGGGGGGTSTSSVRTVPDWAIPYVTAYWDEAYALWQANTLAAYSGDVTAAQPQDEVDGIDGLANRGRYGDQVITKAIAYEDDVINGGYLAGSKAAFLAALALVTGNSTTDWASVYSRIGRKPLYVGDTDSSILAQRLVNTPRYGVAVDSVPTIYNARMSALIYADNWRKERDIQNQGLGYGVEMGKHAAIDAEALRRAGLYQREYLQGTYELAHKLFVEGQEIDVANLEIFGNAIRALTGSQQTTTQDMPGANKVMTAVGGAVAGATAGWFLGGPVGAVVGGIVGGVIGWFG